MPRLVFALFFAGCSAICSCLPSTLFLLGHVLLISSLFILYGHMIGLSNIVFLDFYQLFLYYKRNPCILEVLPDEIAAAAVF